MYFKYFFLRHRPTKSKLECKLEFFGFEDGVCEDGDTEPGTSYKIKYFGFDELSESDSEDDDDDDEPGKKKKEKDTAEMMTAASDCPQISDAPSLTHTLTGTVCSQSESGTKQCFICARRLSIRLIHRRKTQRSTNGF